MASSELCRPPIDAGFQRSAPAESIGAAVDAPPIDLLIGPAPSKAMPCAWIARGSTASTSNEETKTIDRKTVSALFTVPPRVE
jgi:hypothetical protein